jgi:hypothetical protein
MLRRAKKGRNKHCFQRKLRLFISLAGRNLWPQSRLNQDITGAPERRQEQSLKWKATGSGILRNQDDAE